MHPLIVVGRLPSFDPHKHTSRSIHQLFRKVLLYCRSVEYQQQNSQRVDPALKFDGTSYLTKVVHHMVVNQSEHLY